MMKEGNIDQEQYQESYITILKEQHKKNVDMINQ